MSHIYPTLASIQQTTEFAIRLAAQAKHAAVLAKENGPADPKFCWQNGTAQLCYISAKLLYENNPHGHCHPDHAEDHDKMRRALSAAMVNIESECDIAWRDPMTGCISGLDELRKPADAMDISRVYPDAIHPDSPLIRS